MSGNQKEGARTRASQYSVEHEWTGSDIQQTRTIDGSVEVSLNVSLEITKSGGGWCLPAPLAGLFFKTPVLTEIRSQKTPVLKVCYVRLMLEREDTDRASSINSDMSKRVLQAANPPS